MEGIEVDSVKDVMKCPICSNKYNSPITLPCGETICRIHSNNMNISEGKFKCELCAQEHIYPDGGFPENRVIQRMLQVNIDKLDIDCYFYKSAKESFDNLYNKLKLFETIQNNPVCLIEDYFFELINKITNVKSDLKSEIDNHFNKLINEMELYMNECIVASEKNKELSNKELDYFQKEVGKDFKMFDLNESKWKDIEMKSNVLINKIEFKLKETINYFLLNKTYELKMPEITLGQITVKSTENLTNLNQKITHINNSLSIKLMDGSWEKYKLVNYDDMKYDVNLNHINQLDTEEFVKKIFLDESQIKHLNLIQKIESKQIKNYVILRKENLNVENQAIICVVYKEINPMYQHEFLNDLGFAVMVKNAKFEKI